MRLTGMILPATCAVFCGVAVAHDARPAPAAFGNPTREQAIAAVVQRLLLLQNVTASFKMVRHDIITPQLIAFEKKTMPWLHKVYPNVHFGKRSSMPQTRSYLCKFRFLHGRVYYARDIPAAAKGPSEELPTAQIQAVTPARAEHLTFPAKADFGLVQVTGAIENRGGPLDSLLISSALGLRPLSHHGWMWLDAALFKKMKFVDLGNGSFSLTQIRRDGVQYQWTFALAPSIKLVGVRESWTLPGRPNSVLATVRSSNFHRVAGLLLPARVVETQFSGRRFLPGPLRHITLTHIKYKLGSKLNTPKSYFILFPKGSVVIDERIGAVFHITKPTVLSDKEIFKRLKKRDGAKAR